LVGADWTNYKQDFPKKDMSMLDLSKAGLTNTPAPVLRDMFSPPPEKLPPHIVPADWKGYTFKGAWPIRARFRFRCTV
jgi:hypothetical protein